MTGPDPGDGGQGPPGFPAPPHPDMSRSGRASEQGRGATPSPHCCSNPPIPALSALGRRAGAEPSSFWDPGRTSPICQHGRAAPPSPDFRLGPCVRGRKRQKVTPRLAAHCPWHCRLCRRSHAAAPHPIVPHTWLSPHTPGHPNAAAHPHTWLSPSGLWAGSTPQPPPADNSP